MARWWWWLVSWWRGDDEDDNPGVLRALPDATRPFVTALRVPKEDGAPVVFLLAAQSLSERSAFDASQLVRLVQPSAVIAQVPRNFVAGLGSEEANAVGLESTVPTTVFGVISDCFKHPDKRASYENKAGVAVLRSIFGTTFQGHVFSAKDAAKLTNSAFLFLETPSENAIQMSFGSNETTLPVHSSLFEMFKSLGLSVSSTPADETGIASGECPQFAGGFYPFLVAIEDAYSEMPVMKQALYQARNLLFDIEQGKAVEPDHLAQAQNLRIAVENLRIAFNAAAKGHKSNEQQKFENLSPEEQSHVLLAQAIQEQAREHGTVVAIVDASSMGGIRKHWKTEVPPEVLELARHSFLYRESSDGGGGFERARRLEKTLVGSGAVAVVGIASLPWWAPSSPITKVLVLKAPAFMKMGLIQLKRNAGVYFAKTVVPFTTPGKFTALIKTATSAGKTRAAAHSLVATMERASFSAMRTAFYSLMRKKQGMSSGGRPWLLLATSIGAGAAVISSKDRLEAAIESVPHAPRLARLGRGLEKLRQATEALRSAQA